MERNRAGLVFLLDIVDPHRRPRIAQSVSQLRASLRLEKLWIGNRAHGNVLSVMTIDITMPVVLLGFQLLHQWMRKLRFTLRSLESLQVAAGF